jgi:predicted MFS family arabinose efflux permease
LIDAVSFVADALLIGRISVHEPRPDASHDSSKSGIRSEISDGLGWLYRHPTLAPMSISTHVWFFGNNVMLTVLAPFALRGLELSSLMFGLLFTVLGAATLAGAMSATRLGTVLGIGHTIVVCRVGYTVALTAIGLAASPSIGAPVATAVVFVALGVWGLVSGVENPNEMGYRQTIVPPKFLGRVNSTARSANRTCAVLGALAGGAVAGAYSFQIAFWLGAITLAGAVLIAVLTPLRSARIEASNHTDQTG